MNFYDITIHDFLETLVEWVFEYYVFAIALFWKMPRKSRFFLRYILGLLVIVGLCYPLAIFNHLYGNTVLGRSFVYITLFGAAIGHHFLCYKHRPTQIFVFADLAYLIQNGVYRTFSLFYTLGMYLAGPGHLSEIGFKFMYYGQFLLQALIVCFTLVPAAKKRLLDQHLPRFVVAISVFTVILGVVVSSLFDVNIDIIAQGSYVSPTEAVYFLRLSTNFTALMLNAAIIIMLFSSNRARRLTRDIDELNYLVQQSAKQYEISQQTIDSINIKCHDMKHRINSIVGGALPEDAIRDINESIAIYDALIDTGYRPLDVILTEKNLLCESHGIAFTKTVDGRALSFMSNGDLFCLFGNALDNAIEAACRVPLKEKRYVNLSVRSPASGIVQIECMNYYVGDISFDGELPTTSKGDTVYHGYGVRSIREIVQHYDGQFSIDAKDGVFTLRIVLFAPTIAN